MRNYMHRLPVATPNPSIPHRFPVGELPDANLVILEYAPDGKPRESGMDYGRLWRYQVEFDCCSRRDVLCHRAIQIRLNSKTAVCRMCSLVKGQRPRRGITAGDNPFADVPWPAASTARPRP
jgi:hypothetical protein